MSITGDDPMERTGRVSFSGVIKEVNLAYVPEANIGDYVIVHAGFAISKVDEKEAEEVFNYIKQIEQINEIEK